MSRTVGLLAMICLSAVQLEGFLFGHDFSGNEHKCDDAVVSTTSDIISNTDIETVFVVYEDAEDPCVRDFTRSIHHNVKLQFVVFEEVMLHMKPEIEYLARKEDIELMRRSLNVVVICTVQCIQQTLEMSKQLDEDFGRKSILRHFSKWILVHTDNPNQISITNLKLDNVIVLTGNKKPVELSTLLWKETGREWSVLDINACNKSLCSSEHFFPNLRFGLNGREIIVVALEWLPFTKKERSSNVTWYTGISGDIMVYLSRSLNFSYKYVEPPDLLWGNRLENGSWTGIVGMLQREEADICSTTYVFSTERATVMSFTYPMQVEHSTVVYKKTVDKLKHWNVLISCFKWDVYAVGGGVLIAVTLTYLTLLILTPNATKQVKMMKEERFTESAMVGLMVPLQQGTKRPPLFHSGQVLFAAWMMSCIVMAAVYRGNLMAFLTVNRQVAPFRTLQELANRDDYDVGAAVGSYISNTLQNSEQPVMKALWKKIEKTHKSSPKTGQGDFKYQMQRLHEGQFAYLESMVAADVLMSDTCDLARINEYFLPTSASMVFPLHSPLSRLFYPEIMGIIDTGLYRKWYETWVPRPKTCSDDSIAVGTSPLHIQEYYSALAACGAGIGLAFLVLLIETYIHEFVPNLVKKT